MVGSIILRFFREMLLWRRVQQPQVNYALARDLMGLRHLDEVIHERIGTGCQLKRHDCMLRDNLDVMRIM